MGGMGAKCGLTRRLVCGLCGIEIRSQYGFGVDDDAAALR
jgi:hypothetical protein